MKWLKERFKIEVEFEDVIKVVVILWVIFIISLMFAGCSLEEKASIEENLEVLTPLNGNTLEKTTQIEDFQFKTKYYIENYNMNRWRITDTKVINMEAKLENAPEGVTVLIEHVHIDMSLKSESPQLDGLTQDSMDDSFHGTYGAAELTNKRLTEKNLINEGKVYANKMQVIYDILVKYPGEDYYHVVSIADEFLIPVNTQSKE